MLSQRIKTKWPCKKSNWHNSLLLIQRPQFIIYFSNVTCLCAGECFAHSSCGTATEKHTYKWCRIKVRWRCVCDCAENSNKNAQEALEAVDKITKLILANLTELYHLVDVDYKRTASIGIVLFGLHGSTQQELLKHTDMPCIMLKNLNATGPLYTMKVCKKIQILNSGLVLFFRLE